MKVVIFCGGLGTRIRDYSDQVPKPMVPIGSQPILLHIMQYYSHFGHRDFVLCLGYKAHVIKNYFLNSEGANGGNTDVSNEGNTIETFGPEMPGWRVSMMDTGISHNIGQRLLAVKHLCLDDEFFLATYGDGLTDLRLPEMIERFKKSGKVACFVAVHPPFNFHLAEFGDDGAVRKIRASNESEIWINGGYFIFRRDIFDYIRDGEELVIEPFNRLIEANLLLAYKHEGFWRAMDTLRDKQLLEDLVEAGNVPWRISGAAAKESVQ